MTHLLGARLRQVADAQVAAVQTLAAVRQAVQCYYAALDRREHGAVAMGNAFSAIEQALGTHWVQGASLAAGVDVAAAAGDLAQAPVPAETTVKVLTQGDVRLAHDVGYMLTCGPDVACFIIDPVGRASVSASTQSESGCPVVWLCCEDGEKETEIEFPDFPGWSFHAGGSGKTIAIALVREIQPPVCVPAPQAPADPLEGLASAYTVSPSVQLVACRQRDGSRLWAVRNDFGDVLNKQGAWEVEPMPSDRDDAFLARCRYATPLEARDAYMASLRGVASSVKHNEEQAP